MGSQRPPNLHGLKDFLNDICLQSLNSQKAQKYTVDLKPPPPPVVEQQRILLIDTFFSLPPKPSTSPPIQPWNNNHYGLGRGRKKDELCHDEVSVPWWETIPSPKLYLSAVVPSSKLPMVFLDNTRALSEKNGKTGPLSTSTTITSYHNTINLRSQGSCL